MSYKTVTYLRDVTNHDLDKHSRDVIPHTPEWYSIMSNACPVCGAKAEHEEYEAQEKIWPPLRSKPKQSQF